MVALATLVVVLVIALTPYLWLLMTSFKTRLDALADAPVWLFTPTLEHYPTVFLDKAYLPLVGNSLIVAGVTTALSLAIGVPAAYLFARHDFAGKEDLFFFFLTTRMAPPISVVVPMFLLFGTVGLIDTRTSVILAHSTFNLSLVVWMMRGFFADIPREIDEAAQMDGHTRAGMFLRVLLPLAAPGMAATAVLCFILSWNEFLYALRGRDAADHRLYIPRAASPRARAHLRRREGIGRPCPSPSEASPRCLPTGPSRSTASTSSSRPASSWSCSAPRAAARRPPAASWPGSSRRASAASRWRDAISRICRRGSAA
jgi:multiple sugar transport system permease protein